MTDIEQLKSRFPGIGDKILYYLINGIHNSEDLIAFRQRANLLDYVFSLFTVSSDKFNWKKQRLILDTNNVNAQKALVDLVKEIYQILNISNSCLITTQTSLLEAHSAIREIKDKLYDFDKRLHNLEIKDEANNNYNLIFSAWESGKTYTDLPWLIEIALLARDIFSSPVCIYELEKNDTKYFRELLINKITKLLKDRSKWREKFFSLADLLNLTYKEIKARDIELLAFLFEIDSIPQQRLKNQPHLFVIGKTLALTTLSTEDKPSNPAQIAFDSCRCLTNKIYRTIDVDDIVRSVVHETANDCLAIMSENKRILNSLKAEKNYPNISSTKISKTKDASQEKLNTNTKYGLVLAGGGARGAYQVGALQYIAELVESKQIQQPQIIAGTSIGALNGAVLASHQTFSTGVSRLNKLWNSLAESQILRLNWRTFLMYGTNFLPQIQRQLIECLLMLTGLNQNSTSFFDSQPIEQILRKAVTKDGLKNGVELWVAAFPSVNINSVRQWIGLPVLDILPDTVQDYVVDWARAWRGQEAYYFHVQKFLEDENFYKVLLASAALPLAFPKQEVGDKSYVDGGLADNVPLEALAKDGCTHVIVIHLDNGFIKWKPSDFPTKNIIEIRPRKEITTNLIDFSPANIAELQKCGYEDAKYFLDNILGILKIVQDAHETTLKLLIDSIPSLGSDA